MEATRICVIGDELVAGIGDPKALGWVGRVLARTEVPAHTQLYPLALPMESTTQLAQRWETECYPRFARDATNKLIVAVGAHDVDAGLSTPRTRLNLANILDVAAANGIETMLVSPPPLRCSDQRHLQRLSTACHDVAERRHIPFIDMYTPLAGHDQWHDDIALSASGFPSQAGYGLMTWIMLHSGWFEFTGMSPKTTP